MIRCFLLLVAYLVTSSNAVSIMLTPATCNVNIPQYSLSAGEAMMFQSPDYPKSLSSGNTNDTIQCSASFTRGDKIGSLLIYLVNGNMNYFAFQNAVEIDSFYGFDDEATTMYNSNYMQSIIFYGDNNPNITFGFGRFSDNIDWTAFQGFVYAPIDSGLNSDCLLNGESFSLTDNTQIIPLFAYGNRSRASDETCIWNFNIPSGYKLKIVITLIYLIDSETLVASGSNTFNITNSGSYIVEGQKAYVAYSKHHDSYGPTQSGYGFQGYVTLVKPQTPTASSCQYKQNNDVVTYFNFDKNGYQNDITCEQPLIADSKKIYTLEFTKNYLEYFSDTVKVEDSKNSTYPLDTMRTYHYDASFNDQTDYLTFTSDDSVVQAGFELQQTPEDCTCRNETIVVLCHTGIPTGFIGNGSERGYCSNMNCNISIVSSPECPDNVISLEIFVSLRPNATDSVTVYGDHLPLTTITNTTTKAFFYNFLPNVPITVQLQSGSSPSKIFVVPQARLTITATTPFAVTEIGLSEANPVFALDLLNYTSGYYNVSVPDGYTLDVSMTFDEIYAYEYREFGLYDGIQYIANLNVLQYPDSNRKYIPRRYESKSGSLIVGSIRTIHFKPRITLFFRIVEIHSSNCPDKNNIFQLDPDILFKETNLTVEGGKDTGCTYTILNYLPDSIYISRLQNTGNSEITFMSRFNQNYPLFSFNKTTASEWNDIFLQGPFNSFIVPENNEVTVSIVNAQYNTSTSDPNIMKLRGIIYSDGYGDPDAPVSNAIGTFPLNEPARISEIQFTCKFLNLSQGGEINVSEKKVRMMNNLFILILLLGILATVEGAGEDDRIGVLPGVNFHYNFSQYSGYLNAGNNGKWKLFYWLMESQTGNSDNDPLIVWYNGGPGCSSLAGMFEELGAFYVSADGQTIYENIFSWNKYANILAIESPIGTGFSYNTDDSQNYTVGDDLTASQNLASLIDFFTNVQPRYGKRQWFIGGESYSGVYVTTLARLVLQSIQNGTFPNSNFGGILIGNGDLNAKLSINTLVHWEYHHGIIGLRDWDIIKKKCCANVTDIEECPFADHFNYIYLNDSKDECGDMLLYHLNITSTLPLNPLVNPYSFHLDCYKSNYLTSTKANVHKGLLGAGDIITSANQLNYDSTDNQFSFPCFYEKSATRYFEQPEVRKIIHVDDAWIKSNGKWYDYTTEVFNDIIEIATDPKVYVSNFRILIFNGDVDMVCNFMGNAKHMDNVAKINGFDHLPRYPWIFRNKIAGYHDPYLLKYNNGQNTLFMDVLTVKGAGHLVPNERPGPAIQMIYNFIKNIRHYNLTEGFNDIPVPMDDILSYTTSLSFINLLDLLYVKLMRMIDLF